MTDVDLILKKLAFIETCLTELRSLARAERIAADVKERRFVEHTLQVCIQAAQDIASHAVLADPMRGAPSASGVLEHDGQAYGGVSSCWRRESSGRDGRE